jgi:hypothetical protein
MSRPMPPTGASPPADVQTAGGATVELVPIAHEICGRYRAEFPDETERYGPAGEAWCLHDNQYLLAWAIQDARDGSVDLIEQAIWLRDILHSRDFPVDRLARNLEIAAAVVAQALIEDPLAEAVSRRLVAGARAVRAATASATTSADPRSSG